MFGWSRLRLGGALSAALLAALALPGAAEAHGSFAFGFSAPLGPVYYPPPAYYPPPVYYPPPAYAYPAPPAVATRPAAPASGYCREYQSTTTIDGRPQPVYGTACLQPDGSWRIISQGER
jgi:hypothetical protein